MTSHEENNLQRTFILILYLFLENDNVLLSELLIRQFANKSESHSSIKFKYIEEQ